jgi:hypothetical protein
MPRAPIEKPGMEKDIRAPDAPRRVGRSTLFGSWLFYIRTRWLMLSARFEREDFLSLFV